jgi:hypothetical protein
MILQLGALIVLVLGLVMFLGGQSWLTILAFKKHWAWGILTIFIPIIYPFFDWKKAALATWITIIGCILIPVGIAMALADPQVQQQLKESLDALNQP